MTDNITRLRKRASRAGIADADLATDAELESAMEFTALTDVDPPGQPLPNARRFVDAEFNHQERHLLVHQGGQFYGWDGACWPSVDDAELKAGLYQWFDGKTYLHETKDGSERRPFAPNRYKIADLQDALRAHTHIALTVTTPSWLSAGTIVPALPADEVVSCTNGLVHWPTRTLYPHTPTFYAHHAIAFAFDPRAPAPARWFEFLQELWPDDPESIDTLQELFGYLVSGDTRLQKMFLLVGPKRSGKGTIARILKAMLGAHNVAGPTLAGIATNFGLSPLIGKPVAVIADARLKASDTSIVTERLLSISGEDTLTVDRKYREPWTGQLPARIVVLSNELPRLSDSSGALASRFIVLSMTTSFYGRENPNLTEELSEELPGIFTWALDGLERLRARGRFIQPKSSQEAIRELEDLGSPVGAFVRDQCVVGAGHTVSRAQLYEVWRQWCQDHGRHATAAETFGRDIRAAVPGLRSTQPTNPDDGKRYRAYEGIGLEQVRTCSAAMYYRQSGNGASKEYSGPEHVPTCSACPKCSGEGCEWCGDTGRNPEVM
jgi:putative DNA primase/helicase